MKLIETLKVKKVLPQLRDQVVVCLVSGTKLYHCSSMLLTHHLWHLLRSPMKEEDYLTIEPKPIDV